jgi:hypothetical protein
MYLSQRPSPSLCADYVKLSTVGGGVGEGVGSPSGVGGLSEIADKGEEI